MALYTNMRCIEICLIRVVVFKNTVDLCLLTGMQHNLIEYVSVTWTNTQTHPGARPLLHTESLPIIKNTCLDQTLLELFQHINLLYFCHAKLYVNDSWDLRSIQYIKREQTKTKRSDQYLRLWNKI